MPGMKARLITLFLLTTMMITDPNQLLAGAAIVPSEMRSAEWGRVDQITRERSFWMAGVAQAEIVQEMRDIVGMAARGEEGEFALRKRWEAFLDKTGYQPIPGQEGTIKDLRSLRRFNVALRTNLAVMAGWARKMNGLQPGALTAQPAYELVRIKGAAVPRDWPARWVQAGGVLTADGRMIAPKLSPLWPALGSRQLFPDALGVDYPPFAYSSGMDWKLVGAREVVRLGIMTREEIAAQAALGRVPADSPGESLQARVQVTDADLRERLVADLGGLAEWDEQAPGTLIFTDPNGTRPGTPEQVARWIHAPMPARLGDGVNFQAQALAGFAEDPEGFRGRTDADAWEDLARVIGRVVDGDRERRDTILRRVVDREDAGWVETLMGSEVWRVATGVGDVVERAVGLLRVIRGFFG